jgi:hypothetical protein
LHSWRPQGLDEEGLLAAYREEKPYALKHSEDTLSRLEAMKAVEGFRSNVLELFDDLHGKLPAR